jgi:hypothetical protein
MVLQTLLQAGEGALGLSTMVLHEAEDSFGNYGAHLCVRFVSATRGTAQQTEGGRRSRRDRLATSFRSSFTGAVGRSRGTAGKGSSRTKKPRRDGALDMTGLGFVAKRTRAEWRGSGVVHTGPTGQKLRRSSCRRVFLRCIQH